MIRKYLTDYQWIVVNALPPKQRLAMKILVTSLTLVEILAALIRFYQALLYTRYLYDQFILFNPYEWPSSILHNITYPYLKFWEKRIPRFYLNNVLIDVNTMIGTEFLGFVIEILLILSYLIAIQMNTRVAAAEFCYNERLKYKNLFVKLQVASILFYKWLSNLFYKWLSKKFLKH